MKKAILSVFAIPFILAPAVMLAQSGMKPTAATYISDEEVKTGQLAARHRPHDPRRRHRAGEFRGRHHPSRRDRSGGRARSRRARPRGGAGGAAAGARPRCGGGRANRAASSRRRRSPVARPAAIAHDQQTEGYLIVSGSGTLVTGGQIVNGRKSPPDGEVTKVLNGPSCSGTTVGADVVKKVVKTGDIIIIPAGVPHGWSDIPEHVDYLSFRPSARVLEAGYVNPALKK